MEPKIGFDFEQTFDRIDVSEECEKEVKEEDQEGGRKGELQLVKER